LKLYNKEKKILRKSAQDGEEKREKNVTELAEK